MIQKYPEADQKSFSKDAIEKSVLLALLLTTLAFLGIRGGGGAVSVRHLDDKIVTFEIPPEIQQQQQIKAPPRPSIPIETESDEVPEDVTIAETVIDTIWTPPPAPDDDIYFVAFDERPEVKSKVDAPYPPLAKKAGIEGTVIVVAYINVGGTVDKVEIGKSIPGLDDAALKAVRRWVFTPAMQRDRPVPVRIAVPVTFRLR